MDRVAGALSTLFTNRVGDYCFILLISSILFFGYRSYVIIVGLYLVGASFTKSAQFPFMGWLPRAMSAPTPVSALVHRSTLVTAGFFLLYYFFIPVRSFFWGLRALSLCFSSILALVEEDFKKLVALRTLSQVSLCVLIILRGSSFISYFHILSHAFIKRVLFLQVGYFIYVSFGQQDFRSVVFPSDNIISFFIFVSLFSLRGLLFRSASISKEWVVYYMRSSGFFIFFIYFVLFFTYLYCWRL